MLSVADGGDSQSAGSPIVGLLVRPGKFVTPIAGVHLTFEQQKELLTLQHTSDLEREQKVRERDHAIRAQEYAVEMERLKCNLRLREG